MSIRRQFVANSPHDVSERGVRQLILAYRADRHGAVVPDFKFRPGMIYSQVRSISSRVNQNYDAWPSGELKKSYRTFLGKPCFVNHNNADPNLARGRVVAARYVEAGADKYIETVMEVDGVRFPKLAHELRTGGIDGVSMGVEAGFTKCSICDNTATETDDMCSHVKYRKGDYLPNVKTGKRTLCFENCYKLGFFELSYVFDPADETAVVSKVLVANSDHSGAKLVRDEYERGYRQAQNEIAYGDGIRRKRLGYGEIEAPEDVDTLRPEQEELESPFKHYVESPEELQGPNLDESLRLDRKQEEEGLDHKRRVEELEDVGPEMVHIGRSRMTQQVGRRFYANEDADDVAGYEDVDDGGGEEAPPDDSGGGIADSGEQLIVDFLDWCQNNGIDPAPEVIDQYAAEAGIGPEDYELLQQFVGEFFGGGDQVPEQAPEDAPPQEDAAPQGPPGGGAMDPNDMGQGQPMALAASRRRSKEGMTVGKSSLAERGRVASRGHRRHFQGDNGQVDGGPFGEDNQGEQEKVFLSETPSTEAVAAPTPGDGTISNTENTLVARVRQGTAQLRQDTARLQQFQAGRYAADGSLPDAESHNPEMSGTDEDLRGDFESLQPKKVDTAPHEASVKAFAAFDTWLRQVTGRTATQHNANFIRRQAARWASANGVSVEILFPTLRNVLRSARKAERSGSMYHTADEKLEVAAPQDRIDVEKPVSDTTDAEAQASQFDEKAFGQNAGDDIADPDLETGSQIWAPGDGVKESKKADAVAAVRCAEAYIKAGLTPEQEKWKLIAQFQTMRHATVVDRTRLLEAVLQATVSRRVTAGVSRGTVPRGSVPPGFTSGSRRVASTYRIAANDPDNDCTLYV